MDTAQQTLELQPGRDDLHRQCSGRGASSLPTVWQAMGRRTGIKVTEVDVPLCKLVSLGYAKRTGEGNRNLYSK